MSNRKQQRFNYNRMLDTLQKHKDEKCKETFKKEAYRSYDVKDYIKKMGIGKNENKGNKDTL